MHVTCSNLGRALTLVGIVKVVSIVLNVEKLLLIRHSILWGQAAATQECADLLEGLAGVIAAPVNLATIETLIYKAKCYRRMFQQVTNLQRFTTLLSRLSE